MNAPSTIKMPFGDDSENTDIDKEKIFTIYLGKESVLISKLEAIDMINLLTGQLYAYELGRS